jgi:hypothetical protein
VIALHYKKRLLNWFMLDAFFVIVCLISTAGGDGSYFAPKVLFPFVMLSTVFFDRIVAPFILIFFIQYPAYGLVLNIAKEKGRNIYIWVVVILTIVHLGAIYFCIAYGSKYFQK